MPIPVHLLPDSCHLCGATRGRCDHGYTNAEADALAAAHDARTTVVYSGGQTNAEAVFVDTTRGR